MKISDAAVEAACEKYSVYSIPRWENQSEGQKALSKSLMRSALQAALEVMRNDGSLVEWISRDVTDEDRAWATAEAKRLEKENGGGP